MDIIKEVNDLLTAQEYYERMGKLSVLADRFEDRRDLNREEVIEGVKLLLVPAVQEQDKEVKEDLLYTIDAAVVNQDIEDCVNWDMFAETLPSLENSRLDMFCTYSAFQDKKNTSPLCILTPRTAIQTYVSGQRRVFRKLPIGWLIAMMLQTKRNKEELTPSIILCKGCSR